MGVHRDGRLGMRGLRCRYGAAAIVTAGTDAADGAFRFRRAVTMMGCAKAASVRERSCSRERERKECSDNRQQQENSCGRPLHFSLNQNPKGEVSIEQVFAPRQGCGDRKETLSGKSAFAKTGEMTEANSHVSQRKRDMGHPLCEHPLHFEFRV